MKTTCYSFLTALLVLLYVYAAISKLADFQNFRGQLYNQSFSHGVADVLLWGLPLAEMGTAGLLLFPQYRYLGLLCSTALMVLFSGYVTLVLLHFWERIPCSCGGVLSQMSWPFHLVFNYCFLLISGLAMWHEVQQGKSASGRANAV